MGTLVCSLLQSPRPRGPSLQRIRHRQSCRARWTLQSCSKKWGIQRPGPGPPMMPSAPPVPVPPPPAAKAKASGPGNTYLKAEVLHFPLPPPPSALQQKDLGTHGEDDNEVPMVLPPRSKASPKAMPQSREQRTGSGRDESSGPGLQTAAAAPAETLAEPRRGASILQHRLMIFRLVQELRAARGMPYIYIYIPAADRSTPSLQSRPFAAQRATPRWVHAGGPAGVWPKPEVLRMRFLKPPRVQAEEEVEAQPERAETRPKQDEKEVPSPRTSKQVKARTRRGGLRYQELKKQGKMLHGSQKPTGSGKGAGKEATSKSHRPSWSEHGSWGHGEWQDTERQRMGSSEEWDKEWRR